MKRPLLFLLSAMLIVAAGCQKPDPVEPVAPNPVVPVEPGTDDPDPDPDPVDPPAEPKTLVLTAVFENIPTTGDASESLFSWLEGDVIDVYTTKERFVKFNLISGVGQKSAEFQATLDAGEEISKLAAMTFSKDVTLSGNNLSLSLPAEIANISSRPQMPMVAKIASADQTSLEFKNVGGLMRINVANVPLGADRFVVTADNKKINGDYTVDISSELPTMNLADATEGANSVISFNVTAPVETETADAYVIPVPAGTYGEYTIKFLDKFGYEIDGESLTFAAGAVVERGGAKIEDWSEPDALPAPKNVKVRKLNWNAVVVQWNRQGSATEKEIKDLGDKCGNCFEYELYKLNSDGTKSLIKGFKFRYNSTSSNKYFKMENDVYFNAVAFGNLEASSNYAFRIRSLSKNNSSTSYNANTGAPGDAWTGYKDAHNSAWTEVEFTTPAAPVDGANVIFAERFDNLIWGTDIVAFGAGFKPTDATILSASKLSDLDTKDNYQYPDKTVENLDNASKWNLAFVEANVVKNATMSKCYPHLGYVKFGTGSTPGYFTTKPLSDISGTTSLSITFDAARFVAWADNEATPEAAVMKVTVYKTVDGTATVVTSQQFELTDNWVNYSLDVDGADATTYVKFESTKSGSKNLRCFLDNVIITKF